MRQLEKCYLKLTDDDDNDSSRNNLRVVLYIFASRSNIVSHEDCTCREFGAGTLGEWKLIS